jgi:hypothetical protein
MILLLRIVAMAVMAILMVFEEEYQPIDSTTRDPPSPPVGKGPGIALGTEIDPELRELTVDVEDKLSTEFGQLPRSRILDVFAHALTPRADQEE